MRNSFLSRVISAIVVVIYISALNPMYIFAEDIGEEKKYISNIEKEEKSSVFIRAKEGGRVVLGEASIEIPEGALNEDTEISIRRLRKVADTGESLYNAIPQSGGYRFLPAGTKLRKM